MQKKRVCLAQFGLLLILVVSGFFSICAAEGELDIFGYAQARASFSDNKALDKKSASFNIQQLNVFLQKNFDKHFSSLVNIEFTNDYSSERKWGAFNLEEAWVKYSLTNKFNVKVGSLIPAFNNLNEIKSKTPLIPYIYRPLVYESSISSSLNLSSFVPMRANVQCYGAIPVQKVKIDYAVYGGNSELINIIPTSNRVAGLDTSMHKLAGARAGIRVDEIKCGVSGVYDWDPSTKTNEYVSLFNAALPAAAASLRLPLMQEVPRYRFGADLSCKYYGVSLEAEYVYVRHSLDAAAQATLDKICSPITPQISGLSGVIGNNMTKQFFYGNLMYDVLERLSVFGGYSQIKDNALIVIKKGMHTMYGGAVYYPIDQIAVKLNVVNFRLVDNEDPIVVKMKAQVNNWIYLAAVSVFF